MKKYVFQKNLYFWTLTMFQNNLKIFEKNKFILSEAEY